MEETFENLNAQLDLLNEALKPFLEGGQDAMKDIREKHGPQQAGEVQLALAYTVNALFFTYLKTQGIDPANHPVKDELARVREYMQKLKAVVKEKEAKDGSLKLNKDAASRFIMSGLGTKPSASVGGVAEAALPATEGESGEAVGSGAKRKAGSDNKGAVASQSVVKKAKKQKGSAKKKKPRS